jgi:hypothetical protein
MTRDRASYLGLPGTDNTCTDLLQSREKGGEKPKCLNRMLSQDLISDRAKFR